MSDRLVFGPDGSPSFAAVADEFVPAAGGSDAHILLCMSRPDPEYVPDCILPWIERGVERLASWALTISSPSTQSALSAMPMTRPGSSSQGETRPCTRNSTARSPLRTS